MFFWSGQLFSLLGSSVVSFAITWYITIVYLSATLLSVATFLSVLVMTLCMPIAGVIADKFNRKVLILVVDSLQAFSTFLLIILFQFGVVNIWIILVFLSIRSGFQAFHIPTVNAIIPTMVPKDKLTRINGINYLFTGVVQLVAPFIGALLIVFLTVHLILWADVITFFIALIPLIIIKIPSVRQVTPTDEVVKKSSFFKEFKLGIRAIKVIPGLVTMIVLSMLVNFLIMPINTLLPLFIKLDHGGGPVQLAIIQMIFMVGIISGALFTSVKKNWNNKIRIIFITITVGLIGLMITSIAPRGSYIIMGIGGVILGFNLPIVNSLYQTFLQTTVPADKLGRVTSIDSSLSSAISPIGSLISGPISEFTGIPLLFFGSALIGALSTVGIWSFTAIRKVDIESKSALEEINGKIEKLTT